MAQVKWAESADFPDVAAIYAGLGQIQPAQFNWSEQSALLELQESKTLLIIDQSRVLTFISFRDYVDRLEIIAVGTSPQVQRQGQGRLILQKLKSWALQQGKPIWLEVHEHNLPAIALYQSEGFRKVSERKNYYKDGSKALVLMWTNLNKPS